MKVTISLLLCITLLSCEKLKDIQGFNGRVIIDVPNVQLPVHPISEPLSFSVSISTDFENIVNRNKIISFDKTEIDFIHLDLEIRDTTGRVLEIEQDFEVIENGTSFLGERITPSWNSTNEKYESFFRVRFLSKGYYWIGSNNSTMAIKRENFLFRDKNLTIEFSVPERQNGLQTNFSNLDDYFRMRSNTIDLKELGTGPGYFFIKVR